MAESTKIGIKGFESVFTKSFPVGNCMLLTSPPLSEISILGLEFIYDGLKRGEPGVIITLDDSPESLRLKALKFGWPLINAEKQGLMRWIDVYSIHANKDVKSTESILRIGGPLALTDLSIALSQIQAGFHRIAGSYRFFFDSLSTLLLYNDPNTIYRFLQVITSKLKMSNGVGFFTLRKGMHDEKINMTIRHLMDGAISLNDNLELNVVSLPVVSETRFGKLNLTRRGFVFQ
jgi:KaiC/GvpD/RAD55 family RecA-like ATPase